MSSPEPEKYRVEVIDPDGDRTTIEVAADESVWEAAARRGIELPHTCLMGWCLSCAARVIEGEFDPTRALRYYDQDRAAGFVLLCTARPRSNMRVLTHQKEAMQQHRKRSGLPAPRG